MIYMYIDSEHIRPIPHQDKQLLVLAPSADMVTSNTTAAAAPATSSSRSWRKATSFRSSTWPGASRD